MKPKPVRVSGQRIKSRWAHLYSIVSNAIQPSNGADFVKKFQKKRKTLFVGGQKEAVQRAGVCQDAKNSISHSSSSNFPKILPGLKSTLKIKEMRFGFSTLFFSWWKMGSSGSGGGRGVKNIISEIPLQGCLVAVIRQQMLKQGHHGLRIYPQKIQCLVAIVFAIRTSQEEASYT